MNTSALRICHHQMLLKMNFGFRSLQLAKIMIFSTYPRLIYLVSFSRFFRFDSFLTFIGKSWKTYPEIYLEFQFSKSWARPYYWKSYPIVNFRILGHDTGRFLENSSKIEHFVEKWYPKRSGAWQRPIAGKLIQISTSFPEIGPAYAA